MQKKTAYSIAKWTSWTILLLLIAFAVYMFTVDSEGAMWALAIAGPFYFLPWIVFLIALYVSDKWRNTEKGMMIFILVAALAFAAGLILLMFMNNTLNDKMEWMLLIIPAVIITETLNILLSRR